MLRLTSIQHLVDHVDRLVIINGNICRVHICGSTVLAGHGHFAAGLLEQQPAAAAGCSVGHAGVAIGKDLLRCGVHTRMQAKGL